MGWKPFKKLGKALKKGARHLKGQIKKHGPNMLKGAAAIGLGSLIPGVGGLLGKAIGGLTGKSGLGSALSQGLGNIGKGGLKGLLGQALNQGKRYFGGNWEDTLAGASVGGKGFLGSDAVSNFAKNQMRKEMMGNAPNTMQGIEQIPPGLLGLMMQGQGQVPQGPVPQNVQSSPQSYQYTQQYNPFDVGGTTVGGF